MRLISPFGAPFVVAAGLLAACGEDDPCEGIAGECIGLTEGADATEVQTAMIEVPTGGTIAFGAGTFRFQTDLSLDIDGVTIRGAGTEKTILSFEGQTSGAQGILVTGDAFTIHGLAIEDTAGDSLKLLGTTGVTIRDVRVEWTGGPKPTNGAYGLYPVQCEDVLIEDSLVIGASDAGIYVGQSHRISVRNNRAERNVAGIEIENSTLADVYGNVATNNTGGILVFNLPGLDVANGAGTRVFDNEIYENNTENFAPPGNIVGKVPTGTGIAILAAHQVEVFDNVIRDHLSVNVGVISYVPIGSFTDPQYDQYPTAIYIHDNQLSGTAATPTGELGAAMITAIGELRPNGPFIVPDIAWDGVVDPLRTPGAAADKLCIRGNGDADFINLAWPLNMGDVPSETMAPHDCAHAPLPAVDL
jgi:parallel beta-helix repeat protein